MTPHANNDHPTVTVIVPVYNVERYLDECVQSIVDQTYANLDIILVNDGSPDAAGSMCDAWAVRDRRVRVVHKENGGLSSARNAGIALAHGEYITFVDSDDVISHDMVAFLVAEAVANDADLVVADFVSFVDGAPAFESVDTATRIGPGPQLLPEVVVGRGNWAACDKLYHRALFDGGLCFTEGVLYEDVEFTPRAFVRSETVVVTTRRLYGYRQRPESIMGVSTKRLSPDLIRMLRSAISTVHDTFPAHHPTREALVCAYVVHASKKLEQMEPNSPQNEDYRREYQRFLKENWAEISGSNSLALLYRWALLLSVLSPKSFSRLMRLLRYVKRTALGSRLRRSRLS